jgi:hypothetical protein
MRMMLRFTLPVEKSNAAINDGSLGRTMESVLRRSSGESFSVLAYGPVISLPKTNPPSANERRRHAAHGPRCPQLYAAHFQSSAAKCPMGEGGAAG